MDVVIRKSRFFFLKHWHNNQTTKGTEVFKNTRSRDSVLSRTLPDPVHYSSLLRLCCSHYGTCARWLLGSPEGSWRHLHATSLLQQRLTPVKGPGSVTRQQQGQRTSRLYRLSCEYGKLINRDHSVITGTTGRDLAYQDWMLTSGNTRYVNWLWRVIR